MQEIKLVVLDVDSTLVEPHDTELSKENVEAVQAARQRGVLVTLATGRLYVAAKKWVDALGIDMPVVACNGADIRKNGVSVRTYPLEMKAVKNIFSVTEELPVRRYIFSGDSIYCTPKDRDEALFRKWSAGGTFPVIERESVEEIMPKVQGNVPKVLVWASDATMHAHAWDILKKENPGCDVVRGESLNLEVVAKGVNKARALRHVLEEYEIPAHAVMAVGDSGNDVELLREAGVGVAVANAMPEAKEAADHIVASCAENGVAEAIGRFVLQ